MSELVAIVSALAFCAGAILLGVAVAGYGPWLLTRPQHWLFFAIVLFSVPTPYTPYASGGAGQGSLFKQLTWGGLFAYSGVAVLGITQGRMAWPRRQIPYALLLLTGFVLLSVIWSPDHLVSFKRAVEVAGVVGVALLVGRSALAGKGLREQLLAPMTVCILLGLALLLLAPGIALDGGHALRGFSSHKNGWGELSLLACLAVLFSVATASSRRRWGLGVLLIAAVLSLVLSRSATSIVVLAAVLVWAGLLLLLRAGVVGKRMAAMLLLAGMLGVGVFTTYAGELPFEWLFESVLGLVGRSPTLTGRTYLWQLMWTEIARHPWLGIGYGGFWTGPHGPSAAVFARTLWAPGQAHNGYLDVVNEVGIVGVALLGIVLFVHGRNVCQVWRVAPSDAGFHASVMLSTLVSNCSESSLLRTTSLSWVVLCASIVEVHLRVKAASALQRGIGRSARAGGFAG